MSDLAAVVGLETKEKDSNVVKRALNWEVFRRPDPQAQFYP